MSVNSYITGVTLRKPLRRILYQINAEVKNDEMTTASRYESAKEIIWLWLKKKTAEMPELAEKVSAVTKSGNSVVDIIYGSSVHYRTATLDIDDYHQWGMSFSHPGTRVATQIWETQAVLTLEGDRVYLFAELSCCVAISGVETIPSVPGFIRDIAKNIGLFSGRPVSETIWPINTDTDIENLYNFLLDPNRNLPVVVLSEPDRRKWPIHYEQAPEYLVSGEKLARSCFGRCVVVQMPYWTSFKWTKRVGKIWSVFDGGVRIYQPSLNMDEDDIYTHPLYLKSKILGWKHSPEQSALQSFGDYLSLIIRRDPTLLLSTQTRTTFSDLFQKRLALSRSEAVANEATLRTSYESQISDLEGQLKYQTELAEDAYQKYEQFKHENAVLSAENHNLNVLIANLRDALRVSGRNLDIPIPDNYDEMEEWCSEYFPDKLVFTTRARRAIKDTENLYSDVALVYRALCFLAQEYNDVKLQKIDRQVMADKLDELQLEDRPAATPTQAGRYEDEYYYTDSSGIKHLVKKHLVRGSGRDPHNTLRIYYYWDNDAKKVVIVSLTRHLTTAAT